MKTCPDCQTLVDDNAVFCDNCGFQFQPPQAEAQQVAPQQVAPPTGSGAPPLQEAWPPVPAMGAPVGEVQPGTCSACGYVNVAGEMFCQNCGVQLAPVASIPPPPPTPVSVVPPSPPPVQQPAIEAEPVPVPQAPGLCPTCGYANQPGEAFCQNCGMQLEVTSGLGMQSPAMQPPAIEAPAYPAPPPSPQPQQFIPQSMTPRPIAPDIGSTPYPPPPLKSTPAQAPGPDTWPSSGRAAAPSAGYISGKLIVQTTRAEILLPRGKTELIIGRSDPVRNIYPDVDLTGYGGDKSGVSRSHARLIVQGFQVYLEDLNSTNFTFLNRQKLNPGQRYLLKNGDEIRVGLLTFEYLEV